MNSFFYYAATPDRQQLTLEEARAWGLGYAFDDKPKPRPIIGAGPDKGRGLVFADSRTGGVGYRKESQTWRQIPAALLAEDAPPIYVGYENDRIPGPGDLARESQLAGHMLRLGDGNNWLCPAAIAIDEEADQFTPLNALPATSDIDAQGRWTRSAIRPDVQALWPIATQFWDKFFHGDEVEGGIAFDFDGLHESAAVALAANYRLGQIECAILRLLDDRTCGDVLKALCDYPTALRWLKKKAAADLRNSSAGRED